MARDETWSPRTKAEYDSDYDRPEWKALRDRIQAERGHQCQCCSGKGWMVHHGRYVGGRRAWEYDEDELWLLCEACHKKADDARLRAQRAVARMNPIYQLDLVLMLEAFADEYGLGRTDHEAQGFVDFVLTYFRP